MDVLLLLTVVCFLALFGSALLIARHVRIVDPGSTEAELPRRGALDLDKGRREGSLDLPERQMPRKVTFEKEPDWRFLVSGERRRLGRGATSPLPTRKGPVSEGERSARSAGMDVLR